MTSGTGNRTTIGGALLFLLLSIALAAVVQLGYTAPAEARLEDRRALRREMELRESESAAKRLALQLEATALADDPQTQERFLRRIGYGRTDELRLESESESERR